MAKSIATQLKQKRAFYSREEEALLGVRMAAARLIAPWAQFLKTKADLSTSQYNVLRILRGSPEGSHLRRDRRTNHRPRPRHHATRGPARKRGLTKRIRSQTDRRVVQVEITRKGLDLLDDLDPHVQRLPASLLGHMSQTNLQQLSRLLAEVLEGMGTFP